MLFIATTVFLGCSSDDDNVISEPDSDSMPDVALAIIRIEAVDAVNDEVILTNLGDATTEVGDYFLCLGPGTYAQVSNLTSESTSLSPNTSISLAYDMNPTADGLSIFTTNTFNSTDPNILLDYVQWGDANQPRVDQAVTAGRWDDVNNFVGQGSPYIFEGNATDFGSQFWAGTPLSDGVLRILNVDTTTDQVTLTNLGGTSIDVASYFLCLGPGTYQQIGNITNAPTVLGANDTITLPYDMNPNADGLSIFANNSFSSSDPEILLDYVQWGSPDQARVGQAVAAGRWDDISNFVMGASPYDYIGGTSDVGVTFWE